MEVKRIFVFLLLGLFMISFVSAFEFDNSKNYNSDTRTVTITNAYGLGADIGTAKLLTPLNVKVGAGYQLVAKFELTSFEDYNSILKSIDFYDKNQKDWEATKFSRTYDIKFLTYDDVEVDDYENVCVDDLSVIIEKDAKVVNGTNTTKPQICTYEKVGSHMENSKEIWTDKLSTDLIKDEKVIVGIYTNVEAGDYVEWIPTIFGVEVSEWATFRQSTAVGLISYYRLDGSSGIVLDDMLNNHGTNVGATRDVTGKLSKAFDFETTESDYVDLNFKPTVTEGFSVSVWFKEESSQVDNYIINQFGAIGAGNASWQIKVTTTDKITFTTYDGSSLYNVVSTNTYNDASWHLATLVWDGTGGSGTLHGYIDGTEIGSGVSADIQTSTNYNVIVGKEAAGSADYFDGLVDEVGIWERAITQTEITEIYNSGTGENNPRTDYFWDDYDLDAGLEGYWKLDETTGTNFNDESTNNWDLTASSSNVTSSTTGVIGTIADFTTGGTYYMSNTDVTTSGNSLTFSMWLKGTTRGQQYLIDNRGTAGNDGLWRFSSGGIFEFYDGAGALISFTLEDGDVFNDNWNMLTLSLSGTTADLYFNGALFETKTISNTNIEADGNFVVANIEGGGSGTADLDGEMDELGIWDIALNETQIQALFNYSSALVYGSSPPPDNPPTITGYNSTANYTEAKSYNFVYNAYDDIQLSNVSIYVNDVLNQTNTDGTNNTDYTFSVPLTDGTYEILGSATDNISQTTNTSAITIIVNTTPNIQFESPTPVDNANVTASPTINVSTTETYFNKIMFTINGTQYNYTDSTRSYTILTEGTYDYNVTMFTTTEQSNITETRTVNIDSTLPEINITAPTGTSDYFVIGNNETLNYSIADTNLDSCWYNYERATKIETNITQGKPVINESSFEEWLYNGTLYVRTIGRQNGAFEINTTFEKVTTGDLDIHLNVSSYMGNVNDPAWIRQVNLSLYNYNTDTYDLIDSVLVSTTPGNGYSSGDVNYTNSDIDTKYINNGRVKFNYYLWYYDSVPNAWAVDQRVHFNYSNLNGFVSLNCSETSIDFYYIDGVNTLTVYANDTLGNTNSELIEWNYKILQINLTYNEEVLDLSLEDFVLYVEATEDITSSQLHYNGNVYDSSILSLGSGIFKISNYIQIPDVAVNTNYTFYFNITTTTSSFATATNNQSVFVLLIDNCGVYTNEFFNISLYDEKTLELLLGTIEVNLELFNSDKSTALTTAASKFYNMSNMQICSNVNLTGTGYYYDLELRYYVDPTNTSTFLYVPEFYHIQKGSVSNFKQDINLYNLNINQSTEFTMNYRDNDYVARPNVLLQIERKYISEGIYRTVEIPITSSEGSAVGHFDLDNYKYKIIATYNGEILNTFDNPAIVCESELSGLCVLTLNGQGEPDPFEDYDTIRDVSYTISYNNTEISLEYVIPSGETRMVNVYMYQSSPFADDKILCNQSLTSSAGSFTCTANSTIGDSNVFIEIRVDGNLEAKHMIYYQEDLASYFLLNNYIIASLFLILLVTMMVSSPMIMVATSIFSVVVLGFLFLIKGSSIGLVVGSFSWLVVAGILILVKLNKKDET